MTSFQWKRKRPLRTTAAAAFSSQGEADELEDTEDGVDWLTASKRQRLFLLEDARAKTKRLIEEGTTLAEHGRYWEAIKHWDEALELDPASAPLHEMKAQVLLEVGEVFPATQMAERAVALDPTWAVARQTLGRAQLGIGEVHMALQNFQKALHLDPLKAEVRNEDMKWAQELVRQKEARLAEETVEGHSSEEKRVQSEQRES